MRMHFVPFFALVLSVGLVAPSIAAIQNDRNTPEDRIEVVGHFPLAGGSVNRLLATQHYGRSYLYAEAMSGRAVTVIDVTNVESPFLVASESSPPNGNGDDLLAVAGSAVLTASPQVEPEALPQPQSVSIVSFADPAHPKITRKFTGVTAIGRDNQRGLVFLANADGVWILRERLAEDPAVLKAYSDYVLYSH